MKIKSLLIAATTLPLVATGAHASAPQKKTHIMRKFLFTMACLLVGMICKAEEVQYEGVRYDINRETKLAKVLGEVKGQEKHQVSIPECIQHEGEKYVVVAIGQNAFSGSKLSAVLIPDSVGTIENFAFSQCTNMVVFISYAKTPPAIQSTSLPARKMWSLSVPPGCAGAYKASQWSNYFYEIDELEVDPDQIDQQETDSLVYNVVDENADFPRGTEACMKWLSRNIKYPEICEKLGIQGRVIVKFVVERDGSICDVKVIRSPDENLSAEAVRVVNSMPKWKPAKFAGKTVRSRFYLPILFRLG